MGHEEVKEGRAHFEEPFGLGPPTTSPSYTKATSQENLAAAASLPYACTLALHACLYLPAYPPTRLLVKLYSYPPRLPFHSLPSIPPINPPAPLLQSRPRGIFEKVSDVLIADPEGGGVSAKSKER